MSSIIFNDKKREDRSIKTLIIGAILAVPASIFLGIYFEGSVDYMFFVYPFALLGISLCLVILDYILVIPITTLINKKRKKREATISQEKK